MNVNPMPINLLVSPGQESVLFSMLCHKDGVIEEEEEEEKEDVISQMIQLQSSFPSHLFHWISDNQERCNYLKWRNCNINRNSILPQTLNVEFQGLIHQYVAYMLQVICENQ